MLKNQELIFRMSLHQRLRLITSAKADENCAVENYEFPVFHFYPNPSLKSSDKFATFFPSDKALAATWNGEIIRNVYECTGNEAKANKEYAYFNITGDAEREGISEDAFLTIEFLKQKAAGIYASGAYLNYDDCAATENKAVLNETVKGIADGVISGNKARSLRVYSTENAEKLSRLHAFNGFVYGVAAERRDVAKYITFGCTMVFVSGEIFEGLEDYLVELTEKFAKAKEECDEGLIDGAELDRRKNRGEILDPEAINSACDGMINLLLALKERGAASVEEKITCASKSPREAYFNEVYHDKLAYSAAQQSIVLIKNNGALPLDKNAKIAVIGEYATNNDYRITNKNKPTVLRRPFDEINNYPLINAVGYAHGYAANESKRLDLIETALNLCDEAGYALVYLCAGKGATALPVGQTELLDALSRKGVKIIAVVSAECAIDLSFASKCEAVLFSYNVGQGGAQAVFDVLTGEISPSGKLVDTFYRDANSATVEEGVPAYCNAPSANVLYPFGYGLSFTKFECKNLKITDGGVSCTVTNRGKFDGYCTLLMFVRRVNAQSSLANDLLRGYCKVFVKKGDSVKAEIVFDENTFKVYDKNNDRLYMQGGKYVISLCDNASAVLLRGERDFKERLYTEKIVNKVVETSANGVIGFTDTELDKLIRKEKKKLSFGFRLFIAVALTLYYDGMGVGLLVTNLITDKTPLLYAVIGGLLFVGNLLAFVYVAIIVKRRDLQKFLHPNEVLGDMVNRVKEFNEIAKVTYDKPVERPVAEFDPVEDEEEETKTEEEVARRYDATFAEEAEEIELSPKVSFNELCSAFRTFAANRGLTVEVSSVRAMLAAMVSGRVLFVSCKNKETLPAFIDALCEYFGIFGRVTASDEWKSQEDLLWKKGGSVGDYVLSDFSNAINSSCKTPDRNSFILLENVSTGNLGDYFSAFLDYANFPSEEHVLKFGEDVSLTMPKNLCFLLVPSSDNFTEELTPAAAHAGILVEVLVSKAAVPQTKAEEEIKILSRADLADLMAEAREQFFVSESVWKKLDGFTEAVNASERFSIDNKSLLQLERYTSVLMECGADENEAVVNMFIAKILLLLKVSKAYRKENGGKTLYGIIEKLFGEEDLSAVQRALVSSAN